SGTGADGGSATTYHAVLTATKKRLVLDAVRAAGGNVTKAAEQLDLHPNYLHRLITQLELRDQLDR
ncbi:MAG TPA: helix-turn-helix domain-containing protein, partial [Thermoanaerobaculia bacterium]|nr:helix-turn-helix domain-containing protein [Thermoanaerobaculia bacterium]